MGCPYGISLNFFVMSEELKKKVFTSVVWKLFNHENHFLVRNFLFSLINSWTILARFEPWRCHQAKCGVKWRQTIFHYDARKKPEERNEVFHPETTSVEKNCRSKERYQK